MATARTINEILDGFLSRTKKVDGHWLYQGPLDKDGYGIISFRRKPYSIHRFIAYVCLGLQLDSKNQSNHKDICPFKNCWNPSHLRVGNHKSNMKDSYRMGTHRNYWGRNHHGA